MKKFIAAAAIIFCMAIMMFAEYRYIMRNIKPYSGDNGTVYIELFGCVDEYYADSISELDNN